MPQQLRAVRKASMLQRESYQAGYMPDLVLTKASLMPKAGKGFTLNCRHQLLPSMMFSRVGNLSFTID